MINPEWDQDMLEKEINKMIKENFRNPEVTLDNNYTGEMRKTTLLSVFEWERQRKPILAGNGTFYKNQYEAENPIAAMLDNFLITRKKLKKEMFQIQDTSSVEYKDLDRSQQNQKINANSYYGASGNPASPFYSLYSGPATTLSAQSVISTTENFFESLLGDNYRFMDLNELFHWINTVLEEDIEFDKRIVTCNKKEVLNRLYSKIVHHKENDYEILDLMLDNFDEEELSILYYKNNFIEFIDRHEFIQDLFKEVMTSINNIKINDIVDWGKDKENEEKKWKEYISKEYFMNPNHVPDSIQVPLDTLKDYVIDYIYVEYTAFDRIYRLKNFTRKVVTVIDTDSNILSMDTICEYLFDKVVNDFYGRDHEYDVYILVNTLAYILTDMIQRILLCYARKSNIPDEFGKRYTMKNELFMPLLIIGMTKKRYMSKITLREGNQMNPPKTDIKGFDFKKASCSEYAEGRFMKIIKDDIFDSDTVDLRSMIISLREFENEVRTSILSGDRTFLPNGSMKDLRAYKDPASEQSVRGTLTWNMLYPENRIEIPSKVSLVKMNIFDEDDIKDLKSTHPDIYEIIINKIFNDESQIFVTKKWISDEISYINPRAKDFLKLIPKKYRTKFKGRTVQDWNEFVDSIDDNDPRFQSKGHWEIKKRGLQVLAIPSNATIPEWAIPYVDIDTMVNNIIAPFKPVLEIFNSRFTPEGKMHNGVNRKTDKLTNIVKF